MLNFVVGLHKLSEGRNFKGKDVDYTCGLKELRNIMDQALVEIKLSQGQGRRTIYVS